MGPFPAFPVAKDPIERGQNPCGHFSSCAYLPLLQSQRALWVQRKDCTQVLDWAGTKSLAASQYAADGSLGKAADAEKGDYGQGVGTADAALEAL